MDRTTLLSLCFLCLFGIVSCVQKPVDITISDTGEWERNSAEFNQTEVRENDYNGGNFDVLGDGALLLKKTDEQFKRTSEFYQKGDWTSVWFKNNGGKSVSVDLNVKNYGQEQNMDAGWRKFEGNPLVAPKNSPFATEQSLQLPVELEGNDQSIVRGTGEFEGKWLLVFNVGGWAVGGWAAAVADSLAPITRGENPFTLIDPFPIHEGIDKGEFKGFHAPNDWIEVGGVWYAPDESRDHHSRMWTSTDFINWENRGPIKGMVGHDPGMVYDDSLFYLFNEDGNNLQYLSATDPLGEWTSHGLALEVGDHTGDADLSYFNNAWHMFFDDGVHFDYKIGYASTTPEEFPLGWKLQNDVFGPRKPDQGQQWDEPGDEGNNFGTGDADLAVEDDILYIVYERPIGIAWKKLDLTDKTDQNLTLILEVDHNDDGRTDAIYEQPISARKNTLKFDPTESFSSFRISLRLETQNPRTSAMIQSISINQ